MLKSTAEIGRGRFLDLGGAPQSLSSSINERLSLFLVRGRDIWIVVPEGPATRFSSCLSFVFFFSKLSQDAAPLCSGNVGIAACRVEGVGTRRLLTTVE